MPAIGSLPTPPAEFAPVPVIVKMQVLFSIISRSNHWGGPNDPKIHLMFTPLVTLHHPSTGKSDRHAMTRNR
ncbi:MAG: hypothetical protein NTW21_26835 [Verrucomicrobia bacterium]|nr:hypothetical protein [Verrucomicrobiota bacterium]